MTDFLPRPSAAIIAVFLTLPLLAQQVQAPVFAGEIRGASELSMHGYMVVLDDVSGRRNVAQADVQSDGTFRFRNVPYGDYMLKVETYFGDVLFGTFVTVDARAAAPTILLPKNKDERPPSGGVSAARLLHPPDRNASRAFATAQKLSHSGRYKDAAGELEHAIQISPDYAEAHSNLAVQYIHMGRHEDAITEISRARELSPPNVIDLSNLACAQSALGRIDEAIRTARAALRLDPGNAGAHYILGSLLAMDRRTLREGITHLTLAAGAIPAAQRNLERAQAALAQLPPESRP